MATEPELTADELALADFHRRANIEILAKVTSTGFDFTVPVTVDFHCIGSNLPDIGDLANTWPSITDMKRRFTRDPEAGSRT